MQYSQVNRNSKLLKTLHLLMFFIILGHFLWLTIVTKMGKKKSDGGGKKEKKNDEESGKPRKSKKVRKGLTIYICFSRLSVNCI